MSAADTNAGLANLIDSLSPLERKIIPHLTEDFQNLQQKTALDATSTLRALRFLETKNIIKIKVNETELVDLGTNGIYYKKNHLPERRLLIALEEKGPMALEEAQKQAKLSDNEIKVSLGVLKQKALINFTSGKISLQAKKEELMKKTLEEQFLELLPLKVNSLTPEQKYAFEQLKKRKDIIEVKTEQEITYTLTDLGKKLAGKEIRNDLIEEVTPEIIKTWNKQKKFRKYDISAPVPTLYGGKRHFVNDSISHAKRIWLDMGFKEMKGPMVDTSFWIFDALFTPQDHPAREMQDTFFIKGLRGTVPNTTTMKNIKESHEKGVGGSKGWGQAWKPEEASKLALRTHTTGLSARTLAQLKREDLPAKYFTIGKVFRNETLDWSHLFEFYQTEGIVIDKKVNLRNLLGYLTEFYKKMGYDKIKFLPSFFPYTEPSVEIYAFHPGRKIWVELGGAGVFRPEVTIPLLGEGVQVLAWGQGFERIIMEYHKIKDLREVYKNNIGELRTKPVWIE